MVIKLIKMDILVMMNGYFYSDPYYNHFKHAIQKIGMSYLEQK